MAYPQSQFMNLWIYNRDSLLKMLSRCRYKIVVHNQLIGYRSGNRRGSLGPEGIRIQKYIEQSYCKKIKLETKKDVARSY